VAAAAAKGSDAETKLREAIGGFRHDPLGFVLFVFPWGVEGTELEHEKPREWQAAQLKAIGDYLRAGGSVEGALRIAVASGHGIGKSALVAWVLLWALATFPMTKVTITANTDTQMRTKTWPEISKWFGLMVCQHWFALEATSIRARGPRGKVWRCDAVPWSANNTTAFQGLHNKGKRVVLIFDEASEIADKIWEVADGALTDENTEIIWLAFGNPTINTGRFRECFAGGRFSKRWKAEQIDSRTVPGTNKAELAKWVEDWGEDSDFVRVRVKGQFPRGGSMQFIDNETVDKATTREAIGFLYQALVIGVDVARFGDDQQVIAVRRGLDARSIPLQKFRGLDTVSFAGKVAETAAEHNAAAVFVDEGGMGGPVVDMLRKMLRGRLVVGVNFGGRADRYTMGTDEIPLVHDKAAEMWATMRFNLKNGLAIPNDAELKAELTARQYGFDPKNQIILESKADMKKRGLSSPDVADALALTFAYPVADLPEGPSAEAAFSNLQQQSADQYDPLAELG